MAKVSFADNNTGFYISGQNVAYTGSTSPVRTTSVLGWQTAATSHVDFYGLNFQFDGANTPLAGKITSFGVDTGNNNSQVFGNYNLQITGLNIALTETIPVTNGTLSADNQENLIWRLVLKGNDTIDLGNAATSSGFSVSMAGDGRVATTDVVLHAGNDKITGDAGTGSVFGDYASLATGATVFAGDDTIALTHASVIYGDASTVLGFMRGGNDVLSGAYFVMGDTDTVYDGYRLEGGNDRIALATVGMTVGYGFGDALSTIGMAICGKDVIFGSGNNDILAGDSLVVDRGSYFVGGNDTLHGNGGDDFLYGDWQVNYAVSDVRGSNDKLYGNAGNDTIFGNDGSDYIDGGAGADSMQGGIGNDIYVVDSAGDVVDETTSGGGFDQVRSSISYSLGAGLNNLMLTGEKAINGNGNSSDNVIQGNAAHNVLSGKGGTDTFVFNRALTATNYDTVTDFDHATDVFHIDNWVFKGLAAGVLPWSFFTLISSPTSTVGVDKDDRILYDKAGGNLYFDRDGSDTQYARVRFAVVDDNTNVLRDDFFVI